MTAPVPQIIVFFDLSATGGTGLFTLDDPVLGILDGVGVLAGDIATDITPAGFSISVQRGRTSQVFDDIDAATAVIRVRNETRDFDPFDPSGPYFGNLLPGKKVQLLAGGITYFTGRIEDINLDYDFDGRAAAQMECADGLAVLGRQEFDDWTATASELPGDRLNAILDRNEVRWGAARDVDPGISTLQGDAVSWGSSVLNYAQLVARSDLGYLFVSKDGVLTFRDRHAPFYRNAVLAFGDRTSGNLAEIGFRAVQVSYGSENLYNRIGVDREGGIRQTSVDLASQVEYGVRSVSLTGLLLDSDLQSAELAGFLLGQFREPELRISELTVLLHGLAPMEQAQVLDLDITSLVSVSWTPTGVGTLVDEVCIVEGIRHDVSPLQHTVTLSLGSAINRQPFTLDDPIFGTLDSPGLLAF